MGFLSYGSGKALSYTHDYQKDIDRLYQREAYRSQVQAEKEKKSMFYASLMKEQTATAPVNTKKLENLYTGLHKEIADFAINNPGWETDVSKTQEMMGKMDMFINNPVIREDQEVQQQWNATKEALNTGKIRQEEYDVMAEQYHNYLNTGSVTGKEEDASAYIFANPKRKELPQILEEINNYLQPNTTMVTDPVSGKITKEGKTPDTNIHLAAVMGLRDRETDYVITKAYDSIPEKDRGLYASKTEYFEAVIKAGEPMVKEDAGYDDKVMAAYKKTLDNNSDLSNYYRDYVNKVYEPLRQNGETSASNANITFTEIGSKGQSLTMGPNGRNLKMYNKNGNQIEDVNIRGNIVGTGAGKIISIGGVPWVQTQVAVSLSDKQAMTDAAGNVAKRDMTEAEKAAEKEKNGKKAQFDQVEQGLMATSLGEHGFTPMKVTDPGMLASLGLEGQSITSDVYVGTILMPADFSEGNRMKFDQFYTATKESQQKGAVLYNEDYNVAEVLESGNAPVASSIINSKQLKNIAIDLGTEIDNLAWTQDSNNKYVWYSKVGNNDVKYDFKENKTFVSAD